MSAILFKVVLSLTVTVVGMVIVKVREFHGGN